MVASGLQSLLPVSTVARCATAFGTRSYTLRSRHRSDSTSMSLLGFFPIPSRRYYSALAQSLVGEAPEPGTALLCAVASGSGHLLKTLSRLSASH